MVSVSIAGSPVANSQLPPADPSVLLSIIIVSYNTRQLLLNTLDSVERELRDSKLLKKRTEIIVVDNNSSDGSPAAVSALNHKHLSLILNDENTGFARANNQALRQSRGQYILLLNSDTVVHPKALELLVQAAQAHPLGQSTAVLKSSRGKLDRLGILAASLVNQDGTFQPQGGSLPSLFSLASQMLLLDDLPVVGKLLPSTQHTGLRTKRYPNDSLYQQDWVGGTAVLVRREVFQEVGLLDESIFMYGEDTEFCLRAHKHHFDCAIHPQAKVTHLQSASSSSANAILGEFRGLQFIWAKHMPLWQMSFCTLLLKTGAFLRFVLFSTIRLDRTRRNAYARVLREL